MVQDIEKAASKRGVVQQTVKEVLQVGRTASHQGPVLHLTKHQHRLTWPASMQSLVDDDRVHQDKIGISNFFWQADVAVHGLSCLPPCRSWDAWLQLSNVLCHAGPFPVRQLSR